MAFNFDPCFSFTKAICRGKNLLLFYCLVPYLLPDIILVHYCFICYDTVVIFVFPVYTQGSCSFISTTL